jgi:hypothetical protein
MAAELFGVELRHARAPASSPVTRVDLTPDRFEFVPGVSSRSPVDAIPTDHEKIRQEIERTFPHVAAQTKTVLYPLVGADGGVAFKIFPHATRVIGTDRVPFAPDLSIASRAKIRVEELPLYRYEGSGEVRNDTTPLFLRTLGRIARSTEGFRLRRVVLFVEPAKPAEVRCHGVIEFDSGPGTSVRRYIHINHASLDDEALEEAWWARTMERHLRPQAVIVKAAVDVFLPRREMTSSVFNHALTSYRDSILRWLTAERGLLLEDWSLECRPAKPLSWELSGRDRLVGSSPPLVVEGAHYGYDGLIEIGAPDGRVIESIPAFFRGALQVTRLGVHPR